MPFNYDQLMSYRIDEVEQTLSPRDCMLYALGVGFGTDPLDPGQLRFVYERNLQAVPTMANVLAYPGFWLKRPDTGADWPRVLHGEQAFTIHRPLPVEGVLIGRTRVVGIEDKGPDKGAIVYIRREVLDRESDEIICTLDQTTMCRGDGGCGGSDPRPRPLHQLPDGDPDELCDLTTPPGAAILYRLNGDMNPLHVDPDVARSAGFERPILHGLCTLGYAGNALLRACCDYRPERMRSMALRFTAPVYPGETLRTEIWRAGDVVSFRTRVLERDVVVLDHGRLETGE